MFIEIDDGTRKILVNARKALHLTQAELSRKSNISERTIKDIESGRRNSFNETTLILLCRSLDLDYNELFGDGDRIVSENDSGGSINKRFVWGSIIILTAVLMGFIAALKIFSDKINNDISSSLNRSDWITDSPMNVRIGMPEWGDGQGVHVHHYHLQQVVQRSEKVEVEIKWSYHFVEGSTPQYFVNAYGIWAPDDEIKIFDGVLSGDSVRFDKFTLVSPDTPGLHRIRVFFASAFAPITGYYGHPPGNQPTSPSSARYIEIAVEVI